MTTPAVPSAPVIPVKVGDLDVLVETIPAAGPSANGLAPRVDAPVSKLEDAFTQAENTIAAIASSTVQAIRNAAAHAARPDHVEVSFGLCFSAEGGVIVAGASGQASLQVTLIYDGDQAKNGG
jgi:Trypsin-co-occurring domain 1